MRRDGKLSNETMNRILRELRPRRVTAGDLSRGPAGLAVVGQRLDLPGAPSERASAVWFLPGRPGQGQRIDRVGLAGDPAGLKRLP